MNPRSHAQLPSIFWLGTWSEANARYFELMRRLRGVRQFRFPPLPFVPERLYYHFQAVMLRLLSGRYRYHFCVYLPFLECFDGPTIVDIDDPRFSPGELAALRDPRVVGIVTTTDRLKDRLCAGGVRQPIVVIPSGYSPVDIDVDRAAELAKKYNPKQRPIVGYVSYRLSYRAGDPYSDVDLLIDAASRLWTRLPDVHIWLLGRPDKSLQALAKAEPRIRLFGLIRRRDLLNWMRNFTVGTYCRLHDSGGWFRVKLIEYMGAGVPIVATDVPETEIVRQANAGLTGSTAEVFAAHLFTLLTDTSVRMSHARNAEVFARSFDWDRLAGRYENEVFARFRV